jgi:1,4-alpha-glucan branching enzyme
MALVYAALCSYLEFAQHVLPRIKAAGYTAVQLMAVMHAEKHCKSVL